MSQINLSDYFNACPLSLDAMHLFFGQLLGEGIHRKVYRLGTDSTKVVKVEHAVGKFANVIEYQVWQEVSEYHPQLAKWLAPVHKISLGGNLLIQEYAPDCPRAKLPKKVPVWMTDLKTGNWGILKGRPVARDYGNNMLMSRGISATLKKADFWTG